MAVVFNFTHYMTCFSYHSNSALVKYDECSYSDIICLPQTSGFSPNISSPLTMSLVANNPRPFPCVCETRTGIVGRGQYRGSSSPSSSCAIFSVTHSSTRRSSPSRRADGCGSADRHRHLKCSLSSRPRPPALSAVQYGGEARSKGTNDPGGAVGRRGRIAEC